MPIAYFDCFSGASGDMVLGAFMDLGLPLEVLRKELSNLNIDGYQMDRLEVLKAGLRATKAIVKVEHSHEHHASHIGDIYQTILESSLDEEIKTKSVMVFERLAAAEASVHGTTVDGAHLHEVGALDSVIDVVGAVIGFKWLGIDHAFFSKINVGAGTVKCAHGILPVPAPATMELLRGKPIYSSGVEAELITPTGAAILTTLCEGFSHMPDMVVSSIGYGAGERELETPNILRVTLGERPSGFSDSASTLVGVIETNIDDMNPQLYDYMISLALDRGCLDIGIQPINMKKNRPGSCLQIICPVEKIEEMARLIFTQTTAIGLRWRIENRIVAQRSIEEMETKFGMIRIKIARFQGRIVNVSPEYEDCKELAQRSQTSIKKIMSEAVRRCEEIFSEEAT